MPERTNAPKTIPITPAINVKKTDSRIIWVLTSEGVAPKALRIPNSLVLSLTEISKIFQIPTTPAIIVASPTTSDFIFFSKDNQANASGLIGYFAEIKFKNDSTTEAELFSVGSEFFESSK